jgi:hypothetical protein
MQFEFGKDHILNNEVCRYSLIRNYLFQIQLKLRILVVDLITCRLVCLKITLMFFIACTKSSELSHINFLRYK